jgi:hypothetical protein
MPINLISGPTSEPVTLHDLKLQCGLSPVEDTDHVKEQMNAQQLRRYIRGARVWCENYTRRCFLTQTWALSLDHWPRIGELYAHHRRDRIIVLPKPPFQSLLSFTYTDLGKNLQNIIAPVLTAGSTQPGSDIATNFTASPWGLQLSPGSETQPARLEAPWALFWPPNLPLLDSIVITFKCGYGDAGSSVPQPILDAILLLAQFYRDGFPMEKKSPPIIADMLGAYLHRTS